LLAFVSEDAWQRFMAISRRHLTGLAALPLWYGIRYQHGESESGDREDLPLSPHPVTGWCFRSGRLPRIRFCAVGRVSGTIAGYDGLAHFDDQRAK